MAQAAGIGQSKAINVIILTVNNFFKKFTKRKEVGIEWNIYQLL